MKRLIRWLLRWANSDYGAIPVEATTRHGVFSNRDADQIAFEIHNAANGKIVVARKQRFNANGPDKVANINYIVAPDASVIEAISTALVAISLERL